MLKACIVILITVMSSPVFGKVNGLNQIATPDIQPPGLLTATLLGQNVELGNPVQTQFDLGITKSLEVAFYQGYSPGATAGNVEVNLIDRKSFLISAGLLGLQTNTKIQPFVEAGYLTGKSFLVGGVQFQNNSVFPVFGVIYQAAPKLQITSDYVGGGCNFSSIGLSYSLTPTLSFSPALFVSNCVPHKLYCFGTISWNIKAW